MSQQGIEIARVGKDLENAQSKDMVLSTDLISLPIHKETAFSGSVPNGGFQVSPDFGVVIKIPHSLGFPPLFRAWSQLVITDAGGDWFSVPELKPLNCRTGGANGTGAGSGFRIDVIATAYNDRIEIHYAGADAGTGPFPPNTGLLVMGGWIQIFETRWEDFKSA